MPSPLAHSVAGFVIYRVWRRHQAATSGVQAPPEASRWPALREIGYIVALAALSLVPDLDVLAAIFHRDMTGFHNQGWHSLFVGCLVAPVLGLIIGGRRHFVRWTLLAWACFEVHVLMDGLSVGRGVMWLWPFSTERFQPPFYFFHGVRWAEGWWAWDHLFTLLNELGWLGLVVVLHRFRPPERRH